jgi:hypothetical protein
MLGWLVPIVGPLIGIGVVRIIGSRRPLSIVLGALGGQLLAFTLYLRWSSHVLAQVEAHPPRDRTIAFISFHPSLQQRLGSWMILAGVAVGVAVIVLLLQRGGGDSAGAAPAAIQ